MTTVRNSIHAIFYAYKGREAAALRAELVRMQGALQDERARADAGVVWQGRAEAAERLLASPTPYSLLGRNRRPERVGDFSRRQKSATITFASLWLGGTKWVQRAVCRENITV